VLLVVDVVHLVLALALLVQLWDHLAARLLALPVTLLAIFLALVLGEQLLGLLTDVTVYERRRAARLCFLGSRTLTLRVMWENCKCALDADKPVEPEV
jgi:hypothetical protein